MLERDESEHSIPAELQAIFQQIVEAFVDGDFELRRHAIKEVAPLDPRTAHSIARNISAYGDRLAPLHPATWKHSVYRWMEDHWEMLVDLTTVRETVSDLTLHAKLYDAGHPRVEIQSVHVP